jgi:thimet oligopeptidase
MTTLANEFNANVANDGKNIVTLSPAEVAGIDADFLATTPKDGNGNYQFKLNYPNRDNIMGYASNEGARQKFYVAFMRRGGARNITILDELSRKRRQQAQLLGKESFAAWTLEDQMAGTPKAVDDFLTTVGTKVEELEKHDIADLTTLKRSDTANPAARLERWDVTYYQTKVKKQSYALDQAEVRKQFPTQASVDWLLLVSSRLYGLSFKPNTSLPVWHPEVKAFDVYEADGHTYIGSFYMDLFPRDDKYGHAAAWGVRGVSTRLGAKPVSVLVTNFDKSGLSADELETLFHEFGHVLHGVLSKTRYSFHAGTNVKRDFVEAPSQMFEEWTRRPEVTRLLTEACPSCKPVDAALIAKIKAANHYGAGIQYARQRLYASYDMSLVGKAYQAPLASWQALEGATPLGYVPATLFPAGFGHLAGGYAAGYYGYMWSEVMALDMQSAYGSNFMDPTVGARYRSLILEKGGEVNPMDLVTRFLGRAPDNHAFFAQITGTRQ